MKKKMLSVLSALLIAILITSTASAGGAIILNRVNFSLGSLIASGTVSVRGQGNKDVTMALDASGTAAIICSNNGENDVPGQSSPKVTARGQKSIPGDDPLKNGKSSFSVETVDPTTVAWDAAGCPNSNWTARIDFIFWTDATISVYDAATGVQLMEPQNYVCKTTHNPDSVECTLTN